MQNRGRKYFWMTCKRLNILACLGVFALAGISCSATQLPGNEIPAGASQAQVTQEDAATLPPLMTDTPLPSSTPELPTPTFTATTYESLLPEGWTQYKYEKVEMWIPADFEKKSTKDDLIYVENTNSSGNGFSVSISLTKDRPTVTDLDDYIRDGIKQFTPDMTFLEKKKFEIGNYEAERVKVQAIIMNVPMGQALYFIKDGGTIWIVDGISHYSEFSKWIKTFDQIAHTFRINP